MSPESGVSSPAMHLSVVVLPQPEGPRSTTKSPLPTSSDTLSTATLLPNFLKRFTSLTFVIYFFELNRPFLCLYEIALTCLPHCANSRSDDHEPALRSLSGDSGR